jgi:hypothetical protein
MNVGDKVLVEGTVSMVGEGFCRVEFKTVGNQTAQHVRVWNGAIHMPKRAQKVAAE